MNRVWGQGGGRGSNDAGDFDTRDENLVNAMRFIVAKVSDQREGVTHALRKQGWIVPVVITGEALIITGGTTPPRPAPGVEFPRDGVSILQRF